MAWRNLDFDHLVIADLISCGCRALDDTPNSPGSGQRDRWVLAGRDVGEHSLVADTREARESGVQRRGRSGAAVSAET